MVLSQFEEAVWHRRGPDCDKAEAWHHGGEIVPAVEAVLEFGEVAGYMLVADGAISASDGTLDVAEGGVDPLEGRVQGGLATGSSDDWLVDAASVADPRKAVQAVTDKVLAGWKLRCAKVAISARRKPFTRRNFKRIGLPCGHRLHEL